MKNTRKKIIIELGILLALIVTLLLIAINWSEDNIKVNIKITKPKKEIIKPVNKDTSINYKVKSFIKEIGIKYPDIVYAQALVESGHFKGRHFKEKNNIFGMRKAVHRTTLGSGEAGSFVSFKSIEEAIIDYKLYQMTFIHKVRSKEEYLNRLCTRYCKDLGYEKLILSVIDSQNIK